MAEATVDKTVVQETKTEERLLVDKARRGDVEAFSALVRTYESPVLYLVYSFLRNWEDSRDVAQEAFVKAYQALSGFRQESLFSTWLNRIAINLCKDFLRKKKTQKVISFIEKEEGGDGTSKTADSFPSKDPNSLKQVMDRELEQAIHRAMEELPFRQKTVFSLRYLQGKSLEEIAETLHLSTGAVKAHLWQAGEKMKKSLKGFHEGKGGRP